MPPNDGYNHANAATCRYAHVGGLRAAMCLRSQRNHRPGSVGVTADDGMSCAGAASASCR